MTRRKEDFNAITYELFKCKGLALKLKTKIYNNNQLVDGSTVETFFHKEYVYNQGNIRRATISLSTKSYIQIDIWDFETGTKNVFFMLESMLNKFVRKNKNIIAILEAYDDNEIEIITVDSSGTHVNNNIPKSTSVAMGKSLITSEICIMEDKSSVGVRLQFDSFQPVVISAFSFLEMYYSIHNLNFTNCGIALLTYLGTAQLGAHEQDFRKTGYMESIEMKPLPVQKFVGNPMSDFNSIKNSQTLKPINNKAIKW